MMSRSIPILRGFGCSGVKHRGKRSTKVASIACARRFSSALPLLIGDYLGNNLSFLVGNARGSLSIHRRLRWCGLSDHQHRFLAVHARSGHGVISILISNAISAESAELPRDWNHPPIQFQSSGADDFAVFHAEQTVARLLTATWWKSSGKGTTNRTVSVALARQHSRLLLRGHLAGRTRA